MSQGNARRYRIAKDYVRVWRNSENHRLEMRQHALKYPQVGKVLKIVVL